MVFVILQSLTKKISIACGTNKITQSWEGYMIVLQFLNEVYNLINRTFVNICMVCSELIIFLIG